MKPEELRIGNWYQEFPDGDLAQVSLETFKNWEHLSLEKWIDPIPLTPKWLERFGFEAKVKSFPHMLSINLTHNLMMVTDSKKWEILAKVPPFGGVQFPCPQIKHVHELQNLYYALTGEELKLIE